MRRHSNYAGKGFMLSCRYSSDDQLVVLAVDQNKLYGYIWEMAAGHK